FGVLLTVIQVDQPPAERGMGAVDVIDGRYLYEAPAVRFIGVQRQDGAQGRVREDLACDADLLLLDRERQTLGLLPKHTLHIGNVLPVATQDALRRPEQVKTRSSVSRRDRVLVGVANHSPTSSSARYRARA